MKAKTNQNTILTDQSFFTFQINTVQTQACHLGQKARDFPPATAKVTPATSIKRKYSRTSVSPTLKGNEKQFEFSGSIAKFTLPC